MRITLLKKYENHKPGARVDWPNGGELIALGIARDEWGGTFPGQEYIEQGKEIPEIEVTIPAEEPVKPARKTAPMKEVE